MPEATKCSPTFRGCLPLSMCLPTSRDWCVRALPWWSTSPSCRWRRHKSICKIGQAFTFYRCEFLPYHYFSVPGQSEWFRSVSFRLFCLSHHNTWDKKRAEPAQLVDISKLGSNSKTKKFSYSFICGKGYSPLRGRIAFCLQSERTESAFTSAEIRHASKPCSRGRFCAISYT